MNQYRINDTRVENQRIKYIQADCELEAVTEYLEYLSFEDATDADLWLMVVPEGKVISATKIELDDLAKPQEEVWFGIRKAVE